MPIQSKLLEMLPEKYGYVVFIAIGNHFLNSYLAKKVMNARKEFAVEYPDMYSKDSVKFNCIQRSHQNALEKTPAFQFVLLVGGLQYPKISAVAGAVYVLGSYVYARNYSTGDPEKRKKGLIPKVPTMPLAMLVLLGNTVSFACHQIGCFKNFNFSRCH